MQLYYIQFNSQYGKISKTQSTSKRLKKAKKSIDDNESIASTDEEIAEENLR